MKHERDQETDEKRFWATFADGHEEMLVGDAIAQSAREGRWTEVERQM